MKKEGEGEGEGEEEGEGEGEGGRCVRKVDWREEEIRSLYNLFTLHNLFT